MTYASRMRKCFMKISDFCEVLKEEKARMKNPIGIMADAKAVIYSRKLQAFLSQMEEYDIHELVATIGKLFEVI